MMDCESVNKNGKPCRNLARIFAKSDADGWHFWCRKHSVIPIGHVVANFEYASKRGEILSVERMEQLAAAWRNRGPRC